MSHIAQTSELHQEWVLLQGHPVWQTFYLTSFRNDSQILKVNIWEPRRWFAFCYFKRARSVGVLNELTSSSTKPLTWTPCSILFPSLGVRQKVFHSRTSSSFNNSHLYWCLDTCSSSGILMFYDSSLVTFRLVFHTFFKQCCPFGSTVVILWEKVLSKSL